MNMEQITAKHVLEMIIEAKILLSKIDQDGCITEKDHHSFLMAVRRFLIDQKLACGRAKSTCRVKTEHTTWRKRCLRILLENRDLPLEQHLAEIYADE